jgi:hypothetical protein
MAKYALLVLLVLLMGAYSVYAQEGNISDNDRLQGQITKLSSENYALKSELCNVEWRLYREGLLATPKMSQVCQDWSQN